jgi:methionyl aminopeptidase
MTDLCWCGSGKPYEKCHKPIDEKVQAFQKRGCEVPDREMIKTPAQIAGIRKACQINTAVLDEVAKHIKAGMSTEEVNTTLVHEFTLSKNAIPAPLNFCGFPKSVCTSVNDQVCHGIPSPDVILRERRYRECRCEHDLRWLLRRCFQNV